MFNQCRTSLKAKITTHLKKSCLWKKSSEPTGSPVPPSKIQNSPNSHTSHSVIAVYYFLGDVVVRCLHSTSNLDLTCLNLQEVHRTTGIVSRFSVLSDPSSKHGFSHDPEWVKELCKFSDKLERQPGYERGNYLPMSICKGGNRVIMINGVSMNADHENYTLIRSVLLAGLGFDPTQDSEDIIQSINEKHWGAKCWHCGLEDHQNGRGLEDFYVI